MKLAAQVTLVVLMCLNFFMHLYRDFNGRPAQAPAGFGGAVGTIIALGISVVMYTLAGAFSELLP